MEVNELKVNDNDFIKSYIKESIKVKDKQHLDNLIFIFKNTSEQGIRHQIAIAFADIGNKAAVPVLIEVMERPEMYNYSGTLAYACSELGDFSEYLPNFVNLILNDTFETAMGAYDVIKHMKGPFQISELQKILIRITKETDPYSENYYFIKRLKIWLKRRI